MPCAALAHCSDSQFRTIFTLACAAELAATMVDAVLVTVMGVIFVELSVLYGLTVGEKMRLFALYCPEATVMIASGANSER